MGQVIVPSKEEIARLVKNIKQGHTIKFDMMSYSMAAEAIREELLTAIECVLDHSLNIASGDVNLMYEEERKLLDIYASWDRSNRGRRKTCAELIESNKDDTWDYGDN